MINITNFKSPHVVVGRHYVVTTDGACRNNPGPGGWGARLLSFEGGSLRGVKELSGAVPRATKNEMELTAAIEALRWLKNHSYPVTLVSDSQYVIKGMTEWMGGWQARGWRKADGKPVLNRELWEDLITVVGAREVTWEWVRGHSGHPDNERADQLANLAIDRLLSRKRA
jgi:Ribonuclease HI